MRTQRLATSALFLCTTVVVALPALAKDQGRVPAAAWRSVQKRVALDLGFPVGTIDLRKTQGTINLSRGLRSRIGTGPAYLVNARAKVATLASPGLVATKTAGKYLVARSSQGIWEAFPLALVDGAARPKRIAVVSFGSNQQTGALADGRLGGTKVVQAVIAKGADSVYPSLGSLIASKPVKNGQLYFVLGDPNRDRPAAGAPAAYSSVELVKTPKPGRSPSIGLSAVKTSFFQMGSLGR